MFNTKTEVCVGGGELSTYVRHLCLSVNLRLDDNGIRLNIKFSNYVYTQIVGLYTISPMYIIYNTVYNNAYDNTRYMVSA